MGLERNFSLFRFFSFLSFPLLLAVRDYRDCHRHDCRSGRSGSFGAIKRAVDSLSSSRNGLNSLVRPIKRPSIPKSSRG